MSNEELVAQIRAESKARMKQADDEALLAAEAFAYGVFDRYYEARVNGINRRIDELAGANSGTVSQPWLANPADLGKSI